jgi:hypothetical protein
LNLRPPKHEGELSLLYNIRFIVCGILGVTEVVSTNTGTEKYYCRNNTDSQFTGCD